MLDAMGIKRLISHSATPTTISTNTRFTKGILLTPWGYAGHVVFQAVQAPAAFTSIAPVGVMLRGFRREAIWRPILKGRFGVQQGLVWQFHARVMSL
jgi:hypothetical protein